MISIYGLYKEEIEDLLKKANILDKAVIKGEYLDYQIDYENNALIDAFSEVKDKIYSLKGKNLAETFAEIVISKNIKFSSAESLTGGSVASSLVKIAGISSVMMEGLVTYSNESKHNRLGVENKLFDTVGAVSKEVCREMLIGQNNYGVRLCMSTTGIAGPTGDTKEKPLGLTYIGSKFDDDIVVERWVFKGNREQVIKEATNVCIGNAIVLLKKHLNID